MIKSIDFWPRIVAENYIFAQNEIVISITDPNQKPANIQQAAEVLRVAFYDLKKPTGNKLYDSGLFTQNHAQNIIDFLDKYKTTNEEMHLLVHCEAGICRSAAVALFSYYYTQADFDNLEKTYAANKLVVKTLSEESNIEVVIPEEKKSLGGILLF